MSSNRTEAKPGARRVGERNRKPAKRKEKEVTAKGDFGPKTDVEEMKWEFVTFAQTALESGEKICWHQRIWSNRRVAVTNRNNNISRGVGDLGERSAPRAIDLDYGQDEFYFFIHLSQQFFKQYWTPYISLILVHVSLQKDHFRVELKVWKLKIWKIHAASLVRFSHKNRTKKKLQPVEVEVRNFDWHSGVSSKRSRGSAVNLQEITPSNF